MNSFAEVFFGWLNEHHWLWASVMIIVFGLILFTNSSELWKNQSLCVLGKEKSCVTTLKVEGHIYVYFRLLSGQWMDAAITISLGLFGSFRWFCDSKALIKTLGTSWLGFGPVEWVRDELKVLNGCNIKNNYRFIWFN